MWVEQAIYTSIPGRGRGGYRVVARSAGVPESDANALARWAPSHGALIVDAANRTSLNFHPLPSGRLALSRTCAGPAEYSGRGERQLYTHVLILEVAALRAAGNQPIAVYRDAMALGHLRYRPDPGEVLQPVELGGVHAAQDAATWANRARVLGLPGLDVLEAQLAAGEPVQLRHAGDRIALVECLLGLLSAEAMPETSFSTSLQPSVIRPYRLTLVN
jgi:hypothetical protein